MDDCRTSEIVEAGAKPGQELAFGTHRVEDAIGTPSPVADDWVNEAGYADAVDQVAHESRAANHRTRRDRRASIGECELEQPNRQERNTRRFISVWGVLQEKPIRSVVRTPPNPWT